MGDVINTNRFRRVSARERARMRDRFARRRPWQVEHAKAMRDFQRIVDEAPARRAPRRR
jgi:hypothetical protein